MLINTRHGNLTIKIQTNKTAGNYYISTSEVEFEFVMAWEAYTYPNVY